MLLKVLMIVRSTFYTAKGGDTVQVLQTAAHLIKMNVDVQISLTNEIINYSQYNLLHFFNISRPADIMFHVKRSGKPFVVSTIFINYSEFDQYHRQGFSGRLFRLLSYDGIEYIKTISRWMLGRDSLMSISYLWQGQQRSVKALLAKAAIILPNSYSEYLRLVEAYHCTADYQVVPNGIDPGLFFNVQAEPRDPLMVICVARIEGIKNQLNIIRALNNTKYKLLLIGNAAPNQPEYYNECKRIAAPNIQFIGQLTQPELVKYYGKAAVHVLPSWFETTGLSSLEAAVMGCNIVISNRGDTVDYFEDLVLYCDPSSPKSIFDAVDKAANNPFNIKLQKKILEQYTWQQATIATLQAYERIKKVWA